MTAEKIYGEGEMGNDIQHICLINLVLCEIFSFDVAEKAKAAV